MIIPLRYLCRLSKAFFLSDEFKERDADFDKIMMPTEYKPVEYQTTQESLIVIQQWIDELMELKGKQDSKPQTKSTSKAKK